MDASHTLPPGTKLREFRIVRLLGSGGFAHTYLAEDEALDRQVAIKEYFPSDIATRTNATTVRPRSQDSERTFKWGLERFVREAKTLAKFKHPNIVRVYGVFDANETAYIVLDFVKGRDMDVWLRTLGRRPTQGELDQIVGPLLDALTQVHEAGILHRDIKPHNIYIRDDGTPVLLDFGAARFAMRVHTGTTAALVSRGYSPFEAYSTDPKQQGPWTDIYSLAATLHRAISGSPPQEATERIMEDKMPQVTSLKLPAGMFRPTFLAAIEHGLAVMPGRRPPTVAAWRPELTGADERQVTRPRASVETADTAQAAAAPTASATQARLAAATGVHKTATSRTQSRAPAARVALPPQPSRRGPGWIAACIGGLLLAAGGLAVVLSAGDRQRPAPSTGAGSAPVRTAASAPPAAPVRPEAEVAAERQAAEAARRQEEERQRVAAARAEQEARERELKRADEERLASKPSSVEVRQYVTAIQTELTRLKCYSSEIDGRIDQELREAIEALRANYGTSRLAAIQLTTATRGDYEAWIGRLKSITGFSCPPPEKPAAPPAKQPEAKQKLEPRQQPANSSSGSGSNTKSSGGNSANSDLPPCDNWNKQGTVCRSRDGKRCTILNMQRICS